MMRLKVIACDVLNREISYLSSLSKCYVDVIYLNQGLHNTPDILREKLQEQVDLAHTGFPYNYFGAAPDYDYIILGYGLCSNGIVGISSERIPLVIPRGHDCITLLLGSKKVYKDYFDRHCGTYWYSRGWIERSIQPGEERFKGIYNDYVLKYGEDNAEYLMDMEQGWMKEYNQATFVEWDCLNNSEYYKDYSKNCAEFLKWNYDELKGNRSLLEKIMNGIFDDNEALVVPPGKRIISSYDENIITFE
jgi:hypothetical protein